MYRRSSSCAARHPKTGSTSSTSGAMRRSRATKAPEARAAGLRRRTLALGTLGALAVSAVARADTFDLARLTQMLAGVRAGEATFVERREVRMLDRTLVSKGRLT